MALEIRKRVLKFVFVFLESSDLDYQIINIICEKLLSIPTIELDDSSFFNAIANFKSNPFYYWSFGLINDWNVREVTNMDSAFKGEKTFNEDIGRWDVRNVRDFERMFMNCKSFDQNIGFWNTKSAVTMAHMFRNTIVFDQNLGRWSIKKCRDFSAMFSGSVCMLSRGGGCWSPVNWSRWCPMTKSYVSDTCGWVIKKRCCIKNMLGGDESLIERIPRHIDSENDEIDSDDETDSDDEYS